jgi:hypothetical protein
MLAEQNTLQRFGHNVPSQFWRHNIVVRYGVALVAAEHKQRKRAIARHVALFTLEAFGKCVGFLLCDLYTVNVGLASHESIVGQSSRVNT